MSASTDKTNSNSRRGSWAGKHRQQQHESAHADDSHAHSPVVDHPMVPRGQPKMVASQADLAALLDRLRASGSFAYDSEFIGEMTYVPKLCLIQVASTAEIALIDPLADIDLTPFWNLLCDPGVEKIVHAGQQDIEPVVRILGKSPANMFDTQIAAGFVAMTYPVALAKLILELVGTRIGKGLTFTSWDQRPLSSQQLRYAADDVRYLPYLAHVLRERLNEFGHASKLRDECDAACRPELYQFDPEVAYLRVRGGGSLTQRGLAILRELTNWRDACARKLDLPARMVARDETLIDLSRNPVKTVEKLLTVRHLPKPTIADHGGEILAAISRGLATPVEKMPKETDVEPPPSRKFKVEALWSLVQVISTSQGLDPALVTSRQEMNDVLRCIDGTISQADVRVLSGWRLSCVGQQLLDCATGKSPLNLKYKINQ